MDGVLILGVLLRQHAPLVARVPATNIKSERLPEDVPLPAIVVQSVSLVDRQMLKQGATIFAIERVRVTVRAASDRDRREIIKLIRRAGAGVTARALGEARNVAVLTAGLGPSLNGPGDSYERAQDFRVSYDAPL